MTNIRQRGGRQLRANSKLTAAEYAMPVPGLIFLRDAVEACWFTTPDRRRLPAFDRREPLTPRPPHPTR